MTAPRRRIVQIASSLDDGGPEAIATVFALCDDGSLWKFCYSNSGARANEWIRMPDIPQGKQK